MTNNSQSSDRRTSDAAILVGPGRLTGLILEGDGTNAATVVLYDNASTASGTILYKMMLKASSNDLVYPAVIPDGGIDCLNGIYADVTGTGAAYIVHFQKS